MKNTNLGKKYEYEFLDNIFLGYKQKIKINIIDDKKTNTTKRYLNHLEYKLDRANNRDDVEYILDNFSTAMRRFSPFYSYSNVNLAFENPTRKLIDKKKQYLEFNQKKRKNKKLTNLIEESMISCTEQNCFLLALDDKNNWNLYNALDKYGNKKSHTILAKEFDDFYGIIDITLGQKQKDKLNKKYPEKQNYVYTIDKDEFNRNYELSILKETKIKEYINRINTKRKKIRDKRLRKRRKLIKEV